MSHSLHFFCAVPPSGGMQRQQQDAPGQASGKATGQNYQHHFHAGAKSNGQVGEAAAEVCPCKAGLPLLDASPASSQPVVPTPARSTAAPAATIAQPSEPLPLADVQEKAASAPEE